MSDAATSAFMESGLEKGGRYAVLMALAHYLRPQDPSDPKGHRPDEVSVSVMTLSDFSRLSPRQVQRNLTELVKDKVIVLTQKGGSGPGDANTYKITCLDMVETVGFACRKARRAIFAGVAKAIEKAELRGANATVENGAKMIQSVAAAVLEEGHEKLSLKLIRMVSDFHPEFEEILSQKGCHDDTLNKGDICDIRVTSAHAKGDICGKNYLLEDSLENPIARASAREAWERIRKYFSHRGLIEDWDRWTQNIVLNRVEIGKLGDCLTATFESRFEADRCIAEFGSKIRAATNAWENYLVLLVDGNPVERFGGGGSVSLDDMASDALVRGDEEIEE